MLEFKTANLDNIIDVGVVGCTILNQILESTILAPFLSDRSVQEIKGYITNKNYNSTCIRFNNDLSIFIDMYRWCDDCTKDTTTGNYYIVFTGFDFETSWPSYGGLKSGEVSSLLSRWYVIFNEVNAIISPFKTINIKTLYKTQEQHETQEKLRRENLTKQRAFNLIPEHIKGLRVDKDVYFEFDNGEGFNSGFDCEFDYNLKDKQFHCVAIGIDNNMMQAHVTRTK